MQSYTREANVVLDVHNMCMVLCMCMLQKRTNILFDDQLWSLLRSQSQIKGVSIGELVRRAVTATYSDQADNLRQKQAVASIRAHRVILKNIDYKALINYGRKI
jgi:hypothetical protein